MSKVVAPEDAVVPDTTSPVSTTPSSMEEAVKDFFMWRNPVHTGPCFASINAIFYLIVFRGWTVLGLLGVVGMLVLCVSFALTKATGAKDSTPIEMEDVLSPAQIANITKFINMAAYKIRLLLRCDDFALFGQAIGVCVAVSITGSLFSILFLLYTGVLSTFVGPIVYDKYQSQIDAALLMGKVEADKILAKVWAMCGDQVKQLQGMIQAKLKGVAAPAASATDSPSKPKQKKRD